jgi:hypothetical protein
MEYPSVKLYIYISLYIIDSSQDGLWEASPGGPSEFLLDTCKPASTTCFQTSASKLPSGTCLFVAKGSPEGCATTGIPGKEWHCMSGYIIAFIFQHPTGQSQK